MNLFKYLLLLGLVLAPVSSQSSPLTSFTIKLLGSDTIVIFGDYSNCSFSPENYSDSDAAFRKVEAFADEHGLENIEASITKGDDVIHVVLGHGGDSSSNTFVGDADDGCEILWGLTGA